MALGIGLNAATFSATQGLLLRPLGGVADPDELVQVYRKWPGIDYGSNSIPHYQDVRDRSGEVFESVAAWFFAPMALSAGGRSERILGLVVSANFFQTYGVVPVLGRPFVPGDEDQSAAQLVKGMLYDVRAVDPLAFGTVPLMLMAVAAMAVYLPARRAARVEPMRVLKVD